MTSFFDHDVPFLTRKPDAPIRTYWGRDEINSGFAYDGHDGWDYALTPPDLAIAATDGTVVFASNADDNCASGAVVIDHGMGIAHCTGIFHESPWQLATEWFVAIMLG